MNSRNRREMDVIILAAANVFHMDKGAVRDRRE